MEKKAVGRFRRFYRVFRWVGLAAVVLVLFLIFRTSPPPRIAATPEAAKRAEVKIQRFQSYLGRGTEHRLEMDESELNGWLSDNLVLKKTPGSSPVRPQPAQPWIDLGETDAGGPSTSQEALEKAQSSVRDVKIELLEDSLHMYAIFDLHGMDLSLELEGRPIVRDGYIRLDPTRGKLGSFPLMAGTLKSATDRLFDSPENREKFKLPPEIQDIRVENGQLVIISH